MPFQKGNQFGSHGNHARGFECRNLDQLHDMRWIQKEGTAIRVSSKEVEKYFKTGWRPGRPAPSKETRARQSQAQMDRTDRIPASPESRLNAWYKCRYNKTLQDYDDTYAAQGGHCYLCPATSSGKKRLCWDHDHDCCPGLKSCGRCVRGLLCITCNNVVGHLETLLKQGTGLRAYPGTWLESALAYIQKYRLIIFGK